MQGLCDPNSQIKHWYREINGNSSVNVEKLCSFKCMLKCTIMHLLFRFYDCLCLLFFFLHYFIVCFSVQVLFKDGAFQWKRLENLIVLAKENVSKMSSNPALKKNSS